MISPVFWSEITAGLLKSEVEMRGFVQHIHPPWWREADHCGHGKFILASSTQQDKILGTGIGSVSIKMQRIKNKSVEQSSSCFTLRHLEIGKSCAISAEIKMRKKRNMVLCVRQA